MFSWTFSQAAGCSGSQCSPVCGICDILIWLWMISFVFCDTLDCHCSEDYLRHTKCSITLWPQKRKYTERKKERKKEICQQLQIIIIIIEKNLSAWRKENLQILGNIGSRRHQTSGIERKNNKKSILGEWENYSQSNYIAWTPSKEKTPWVCPL